MIYGQSPFSYKPTATDSKPKFYQGQRVSMPSGSAVVRASRWNGNGWEYGLEYPGVTKGSSIWYRESSIRA